LETKTLNLTLPALEHAPRCLTLNSTLNTDKDEYWGFCFKDPEEIDKW
jgi:hypothetical protein